MIERRGMALIDIFHMFVFLYVNTYCNTVFIFKKKILVARIKKCVYVIYTLCGMVGSNAYINFE